MVTGRFADGSERDLAGLAEIRADAPGVVAVDPGGYVRPAADGRATLAVRFGGREALVPVTVAGLDRPNRISFRREIVATFNVTGCNAGACHGTPSGKNGFKLSLWGFDPAADFLQLTRDQSGRRVSTVEPKSSLILQKGEGRVPHEGGSGSSRTAPNPG